MYSFSSGTCGSDSMFFKDLVGFNRLDFQTLSEDVGVGEVWVCGVHWIASNALLDISLGPLTLTLSLKGRG